jgi:MFS family permease
LVLGSFKWVYAALSPFGGLIADRVSRRLVICLSLLIWSGVTLATAWVQTFEQLAFMRALMGISEAFYIPAALALITDYHAGATRSRAVGVHQTGIYCGLILGGLCGYVSESPALGWRWAFQACGLAGIAYAIPLMILLRDPVRQESFDTSASAATSGTAAIRSLLSNRNFLLLVVYFTLPAMAGWVIKDWMPPLLKERFHLGEGKAGAIAMFVHPASILGAALGGWLADRRMLETARGRIHVSAVGMVMFLPALYGIGSAETWFAAAAGLVLFGIGWGFFDCNNMPILCQIVRPELRATGYGLMNLVSISLGGVADWGFGILRNRDVPVSVIFGAFTLLAGLSIAVVWLIRPADSNTTRSPGVA